VPARPSGIPATVAAADLELVAAAPRAGVAALRDQHRFAAAHAPRAAVDLDDVEPRAFGERTALDDLEGEAHRFDLDLRQPADFQPHGGHAPCSVGMRGRFDDLAHALGQ